MSDGSPRNLKPRSRDVTDGLEKTAARGMLRAVGMGDDDFAKPQIGVASSWNEITPCNLSLDRLAQVGRRRACTPAGGYPLEFGTISVSDGISMGHEGMHFSLVSREVIADSVETVMQAERLDGSVLLAGCDKSLPGMLMAAARLDLASRVPLRRLDAARPPGCPTAPSGRHDHRRVRGGRRVRRGPDDPRRTSTRSSARSARARAPAAACTPRTRWPPPPRRSGCRCPARPRRPPSTAAATASRARPARPSSSCCAQGITARDILTREAFENAIAVVMALGGSTNAVLHLLAIAHEAEVDLDARRLQPDRRHGSRTWPTSSRSAATS